MKPAFSNLCLPDWQQEFLKTGINEHSSSWDEMLSKAEAMEQAQTTFAEATSNSKENRRERKKEKSTPILHPKHLQRRKRKLPSAANFMATVRTTMQTNVRFSMLNSKKLNKTGNLELFPVNKQIPTINNQTPNRTGRMSTRSAPTLPIPPSNFKKSSA
jgi:hypothetical protein